MKKILIVPFLLFFFFYTNVHALSDVCFRKDSRGNDTGIKYANLLNVCNCYDDDGIDIKCKNEFLDASVYLNNVRLDIGQSNGTLGGMYLQPGYNQLLFNFIQPVARADIFSSATVTTRNTSGVSVFLYAVVPMSFDYCTASDTGAPSTGDFTNFNFDGFDDLPMSDSNITNMYNMTCRRVYGRMSLVISFLANNDSGAVPMETSDFYYLSDREGYTPAFGIYNYTNSSSRMMIFNLQYYEYKNYVSILDDIDYRNYLTLYNNELVSIGNQTVSFYESQKTYIADINTKTESVINALESTNVSTSPFINFFNNFNDIDHGGISSIVTAPLRLVNSLNNACVPVSFSLFNKNISLPCGNTLFWNRSDVSAFKNIWNILIGGSIVYALLRKMFKVIQNLKDPENDKVEVMKL